MNANAQRTTEGSRTMLLGPRLRRSTELLKTIRESRDAFLGHMDANRRELEAITDKARTKIGFLDFAKAVRAYRDEKLWEQDHGSFLAFIHNVLKVSKAVLYRSFALLGVYETLSKRALTSLSLVSEPSQNQLDALSAMPQSSREDVIRAASEAGDVSPKGLKTAWQRQTDEDEDEAPAMSEEARRVCRVQKNLKELVDDLGFLGLMDRLDEHVGAIAMAVATRNSVALVR